MFKHVRHAPKPAAVAERLCPHGRVEGLKPCPDCARTWRRRQHKESSRIKPR